MITRNALGAIALATTCLAPLAAFAQSSGTMVAGTPFTGEIGVGVMGVTGNNPDQAGRYSGINTNGIDILGNFDLTGRGAWDSGSTRYYELQGNNLVFQTGNKLGTDKGAGTPSGSAYDSLVNNHLTNEGSLGFRFGDQGTWEAGVNYNAITYTGNVIDSIYSVNGNQASLNPGLLPYGGATATTPGSFIYTTTGKTLPAGSTNLLAAKLAATGAMQPVQMGTRRDAIGANFSYILGDWTFSGAFRHEHKEGSMEESFDGPWGGTAFALPIDYDTDRYDVTAAYTTRMYQVSVQNTYSHFSDNNTFVNLPYPYMNTTTSTKFVTTPAAPYQLGAAYSTPPSNSADYVTIMAAANDLIPRTRLNLNARVGFEKQDDNFAPNTADPNPSSSAGVLPGLSNLNGQLQGTTANSLNAIATVYQVNVRANSNPFDNVDTRLFYGIDGRSVSVNQYKVNVGGTGGAAADTSAVGVAFVVPQDWVKQNAGADVDYRILPAYNTKLSLGYRLDAVDRSNAQVGHSWTNTGSAGVSSELGPQVNGRLTFDYIDRSGTISYLTAWENLAGTPSGQTYSGAYYQAPMTSERVTARADYTPMTSLSTDFFVQFKNENYTYGDVSAVGTAIPNNSAGTGTVPLTGEGGGVKQDYALTLGPDLNWRPTKTVNIHLFYTYELLFFNNLGNGACSTQATASTAACAGTVGNFQNKDTSATQTIGVSGEWKVSDKLKLQADYTFSYGSVMFSQFNGVFLSTATPASYQNVGNYPDIDSRMNSLRVTAIYALTPTMDLAGQVGFTSYNDNNWNDTANAVQPAGTPAVSILTPGYAAPNYSVVTIMAGVKFKL